MKKKHYINVAIAFAIVMNAIWFRFFEGDLFSNSLLAWAGFVAATWFLQDGYYRWKKIVSLRSCITSGGVIPSEHLHLLGDEVCFFDGYGNVPRKGVVFLLRRKCQRKDSLLRTLVLSKNDVVDLRSWEELRRHNTRLVLKFDSKRHKIMIIPS